MRYSGARLVAITALLGLAVSIYNYFAPVSLLAPDSRIEGTPGAILVILSTALLICFGWLLSRPLQSKPLILFLLVSALLDILGTAFAAYLLNSMVLLALMVVALAGWLVRAFGPPSAHA